MNKNEIVQKIREELHYIKSLVDKRGEVNVTVNQALNLLTQLEQPEQSVKHGDHTEKDCKECRWAFPSSRTCVENREDSNFPYDNCVDNKKKYWEPKQPEQSVKCFHCDTDKPIKEMACGNCIAFSKVLYQQSVDIEKLTKEIISELELSGIVIFTDTESIIKSKLLEANTKCNCTNKVQELDNRTSGLINYNGKMPEQKEPLPSIDKDVVNNAIAQQQSVDELAEWVNEMITDIKSEALSREPDKREIMRRQEAIKTRILQANLPFDRQKLKAWIEVRTAEIDIDKITNELVILSNKFGLASRHILFEKIKQLLKANIKCNCGERLLEDYKQGLREFIKENKDFINCDPSHFECASYDIIEVKHLLAFINKEVK
jgi:hypothetical protein